MKKLLILVVIIWALFPMIAVSETAENQFHLPKAKSILPQAQNKPFHLVGNKLVSEFTGEVSAYNLGDVSQNDDSPCIGAFNENLCEAKDLVFANNYYLPGTLVCIDKVGCGRVADRMNSRYGKEHFDIAMKLEDKQVALNFGRQNLTVRIYKK